MCISYRAKVPEINHLSLLPLLASGNPLPHRRVLYDASEITSTVNTVIPLSYSMAWSMYDILEA